MVAPWWPHPTLSAQEMDLGIFIHRGVGWAYETWCGGGRFGIPAGAAVEVWLSWRYSLLLTGFGVVHIIGVKHHCHGLHPGHSVQAALPSRVKPGGLELQLIIARNFDERTPAKCSFEASSKSGEAGHRKKRSCFQVEISFNCHRKPYFMQLNQLSFWISVSIQILRSYAIVLVLVFSVPVWIES